MKLFGFVCQCVYVRNDSQSLAMIAGHGLLHHKWLFCFFKGGWFWLFLWFFLLVFSGKGNSRERVVLGSMARFSFLCAGQLGGRWSISSTALLAAVMLPGQLLPQGKREHQQVLISE